MNLVCVKNPTTENGAKDGTSIAFSLQQLYYNNQPRRRLTIIPVSSRRRDVVKFLIE
jgi:hypothetical protein